ncbi:hypothetical protein ACFV30_14655 [Streptomyces sp. NPDC059752]|uniref:hypothetical protein n=1 Tax=unclassified Streptomyces TaxID=2593676 RepID=UPI003646F2D5
MSLIKAANTRMLNESFHEAGNSTAFAGAKQEMGRTTAASRRKRQGSSREAVR